MCGIHDHDFQRPLHQLDVQPACAYYQIPFALGQSIFEAMTDWEVPEVASFVLILEGLRRYYDQDFGVNEDFGPWIPLSAISLDAEFVRYRTPAMQVFHDAFVAFNMSERNRGLVNEVLARDGLSLMTLHSCGVVILPFASRERFLNSTVHKVRNYLRSRANSLGTPLVLVDNFAAIPVAVDMGQSEFQTYRRAWQILTSLPERPAGDYDAAALGYLRQMHATAVPGA